MCVSGTVTRTTGACSDQNPSSATVAAISAAGLQVRCDGSATTRCPVFSTEARMAG